jgi:hypothetical protein
MGEGWGVSIEFAMSVGGHSRPNWAVGAMSGLPPVATELRTSLVVRFVPIAACVAYSMTSSARARIDDGKVMPSAPRQP